MQLPNFLLAALAVPAVNAWHIEMIAADYNARGAFTFDNGQQYIDRDFNDGCYPRRLPNERYLCVDWNLRRGHLIQDDGSQSFRYCFQQAREEWLRGNGPEQSKGAQYYYRFEPVGCSWPAKRDEHVVEGNLSKPLLGPSSPGPEFEPFVLLDSGAQ